MYFRQWDWLQFNNANGTKLSNCTWPIDNRDICGRIKATCLAKYEWPPIIVNFKTYETASGDSALSLAKEMDTTDREFYMVAVASAFDSIFNFRSEMLSLVSTS